MRGKTWLALAFWLSLVVVAVGDESRPSRESGARVARDRLLVTRSLAKQSGALGEHAKQLEQLAESFTPSVKGGGHPELFEESKIALAALRRDLKPLLPKGNRFDPLLNSSGHLERLRRAAGDVESLHKLAPRIEKSDAKLAAVWRRRVVQIRNDLAEYATIADEWDGQLGNEPLELFAIDEAELDAMAEAEESETDSETPEADDIERDAQAVTNADERHDSRDAAKPAPKTKRSTRGEANVAADIAKTTSDAKAPDVDASPRERDEIRPVETSAPGIRETDEEMADDLENIVEDDSVDDLEMAEAPDADDEPPATAADDE